MTADDTKRDSPQGRSAAPGDRDTARDGASLESETESEEARKKFDPYKFQANTMPEGLRAELIAARPHSEAPESFEDTLPPNRVVVERRPSRQGLPVWMVATLTALVVGVVVIVLATGSGTHQPDPSLEATVVPQVPPPTLPTALAARPANGDTVERSRSAAPTGEAVKRSQASRPRPPVASAPVSEPPRKQAPPKPSPFDKPFKPPSE